MATAAAGVAGAEELLSLLLLVLGFICFSLLSLFIRPSLLPRSPLLCFVSSVSSSRAPTFILFHIFYQFFQVGGGEWVVVVVVVGVGDKYFILLPAAAGSNLCDTQRRRLSSGG